MMKTLRNLSLSILAFAFAASAQLNTWNTTTLSAALNTSALIVKVGSASGISGPGFPQSQGGIGSSTANAITYLFVDREAMRVASVSGLNITVERGAGGTQQRSHASGAKVWVGPANNAYFAVTAPSGSCVLASMTVNPLVVLPTGDLWTCGNSQWTTFGSFNSALTYGAQLTTAATIAPTNLIAHLTGTTSVSTITVPAALPATGGCITLIPDQISTTTTTGNIAIATVLVVSKQLILCYDPTAAKWYPSY